MGQIPRSTERISIVTCWICWLGTPTVRLLVIARLNLTTSRSQLPPACCTTAAASETERRRRQRCRRIIWRFSVLPVSLSPPPRPLYYAGLPLCPSSVGHFCASLNVVSLVY